MKMPAQIKTGLLAIAAGGLLALPVFAADSKEEEVKFEDLPAAIQKTITDNADGGTVTEVEKETAKNGTVTYEAEVKKADGSEIEISVSAEGKLISVESEDDEDDDDDENDDDKK